MLVAIEDYELAVLQDAKLIEPPHPGVERRAWPNKTDIRGANILGIIPKILASEAHSVTEWCVSEGRKPSCNTYQVTLIEQVRV